MLSDIDESAMYFGTFFLSSFFNCGETFGARIGLVSRKSTRFSGFVWFYVNYPTPIPYLFSNPNFLKRFGYNIFLCDSILLVIILMVENIISN
tara:strand:- start:43 stop:321 length:279 start_codon:yes stop_codon:yes gene_type:complete